MTGPELHGWSSRLPEWVDGVLDAEERALLEAAMERDPELKAEAELVRSLRQVRPVPPSNLVDSITTRLEGERVSSISRSRFSAGWRLSTAAVLVLAMGTAVIWQNRLGPLPTLVPTLAPAAATQGPVSDAWLLDDGVVAGGAVLDELSDDELAFLLDELER